MNAISVQLAGARRIWNPGEKLQGTVHWALDAAPPTIEIRLFWLAAGAAPQQVGLVDCVVLPQPGGKGSEEFNFVLPIGPWSYTGHMVNLSWHVEAVAIPDLASGRAGFVLAPGDRLVTASNSTLDGLEDESEAGEGELGGDSTAPGKPC